MSHSHLLAVTVNGRRYQRQVDPFLLLVDFLRDELGLTGTHTGCETSQCGCCVVLLDGEACKACTLLALQADGRAVTTVEGLSSTVDAWGDRQSPVDHKPSLHPVQEAFRRRHGLQCGFCTPGMVMITVDLLARNLNPSEAQVREALHGNTCRCTGYQHIVDAVLEAARLMADSDSA
jgi:aerobic-type carbon monoxide dehydrogenase small subunit (CoxS/CutS family)